MRAMGDTILTDGGDSKVYRKKLVNKLIRISLKILFLLAFFILLPGYEAANPKLGNTHIEFYSSEFRSELLLQEYKQNVDSTDLDMIYRFYKGRNYFPAWTINFEINSQYRELISLINSAYHYGLLPEMYSPQLLTHYYHKIHSSPNDSIKMYFRVKLEITATVVAVQFMEHLAVGIRSDKGSVTHESFIQSLPLTLNEIFDRSRITPGMLAVQPKSKSYHRLQKSWSRFLQHASFNTADAVNDELISDGRKITMRLVKLGFLQDSLKNDSLAISNALKRFQHSHIIDTTGMVCQRTIGALHDGMQRRFLKVAVNLDRMRKDAIVASNCIVVNIPEFKLHYYNTRGEDNEFVVVVGKKYTPTPELSSKINKIIANPYWTVTKNITRNEMLPRIKKDPEFLKKNGFVVVNDREEEIAIESIDWENMDGSEFNYWLRQKRRSALGRVKFLFPNNYRVYLHDTQSKSLFNKKYRAYSHGCVRVQYPEKLAQLLLDNTSANGINIWSELKSGERKEIKMNEEVDVHIKYYTCTADSSGTLYFHPDIYSKDEIAMKKLFGNNSWN